MNKPTPKLRRDTRVFISAVSREFGSVRKHAKKGLEDNDYHAVEQDNFPPDYRQLIQEELTHVDAHVAVTGRRLSQRFTIGAAIVVVLVGGIGLFVARQL